MDYAEVKRLLAEKLRHDEALKAAVAEEVSGKIAVIGMHCRFPGSSTPGAYLDALVAHRRHLSSAIRSRWRASAPAGSGDALPALSIGSIEGALDFDNKLFRISPREAEAMDPHHRVMLESAVCAVEDAGYTAADLGGSRTGVFIAMYNQDFAHVTRSPAWERESRIYLGTGSAHSLLPNRISYLLDLHGPSEIVDTACSSAIVALHRAVQAIRVDECDQAIVGGVSLLLDPERLSALQRIGVLSPDGRCALFDQGSSGQVMGEGVAAVLLKREARAVADRDHVYGVIRASGVNHRGRRSGGLTRPDVESQVALIDEVYRRAGLAPAEVAYIEAHGNGGSGDLVELLAFQRCFAAGTPIGSAKANIGCLEAAGGLAQLIKVMMAMQRGVMPATLDHHRLPDHPELRAGATPVLTENRAIDELCRPGSPFLAAIHAYGLGGVNAHLVVQQPAARADRRSAVDAVPILVSGRTDDGTRQFARALCSALGSGGPPLDDLAFTLAVGRPHHGHRLGAIARTADEARDHLDRMASGSPGDLIETNGAADRLRSDVQRWLGGAQVDWMPHLPGARRCSLPVSPLTRITYALPGLDPVPAADLLHRAEAPSSGAVTDLLRAWLARQSGIDAHALADDRPLAELGIDSVVHVELCAHLERTLGVVIPPVELGAGTTIADIAARIRARAGDAALAALAAPVHGDAPVPTSLEERERMFQQHLEALRAQLVPPGRAELRAALEPCGRRFDVCEDALGDLWIFVHTDAGNTFDLAGLRDLLRVVIAVRDHADLGRTRVIYLAHTGPQFSLGGHRKAFVEAVRAGHRDYIVDVGETYRQFLRVVQELPCLTIGVAYGSAQGGGMELLMALDHQVVWPRVKLGFPEVRSGLIAGMGGVSYVVSIVGPQRALALNASGALIGSEEARSLGLISHVSDHPFEAARALGASTARSEAARRVREIVNRHKYPMLMSDIDAWIGFVCEGSVLDSEPKILDDFAKIGRRAR